MTGLISVDEALQHVMRTHAKMGAESVDLSEACGRRTARVVHARVSRPPNDVSAMDGYAVRLEDVREAGGHLKVIGEAPAGQLFSGAIGPNEAVRIFTGAVVPAGADHIVIQENTERDGDTVTVLDAYEGAAYIRKAGLDFHEADLLIPAGQALGPMEIAIAAAANHARLEVYRRPRIGILANGDELRPPGAKLEDGQIINSNPAGLQALITRWGGEPVHLGIAADSLLSIISHVEAAEDIDLFLPVGGASVGDHDFMRQAFSELGFKPVFEKVAVKPGKPTWFSQRGDQSVLGLPGNPASALVCAHLFLAPWLGHDWREDLKTAVLASALRANGPREQYLRASAALDAQGQLTVKVESNQDSSLLHPFLGSNALIRRSADAPSLREGEHVHILPLQSLLGV